MLTTIQEYMPNRTTIVQFSRASLTLLQEYGPLPESIHLEICYFDFFDYSNK